MSKENITTVDDLPLAKSVMILESNDDGLVALEKPAGVLSHPNTKQPEVDEARSLLTVPYDHDAECYVWENNAGVTHRAWLINRLDSATSGCILIALNAELSAIIKQQFATHRVTKVYHAIVRNEPKPASGEWKDQLKKDVYNAKRRVSGALTVPAKTRYQIAKSPTGNLGVSMLKLTPVTGRTHQLRVQCAKHGHPIIGDRTYGDYQYNRELKKVTEIRRMLLHSTDIAFRYAYRGANREFSAHSKLPDSFTEILRFRHRTTVATNRPKNQLGQKRPTRPPMKGRSEHSRLKGRRFRA